MHDKEALFLPAQFFLIRAASFPIHEFFSLFQGKNEEKLLVRCLSDAHFRQALAFSSQTLITEIRKGKVDASIARSLYKYFSRITSRGTPYGLLSFVSWGQSSDFGRSQLNTKLLKKRARPDMGWLYTYVETLIGNHPDFSDFEIQNNPVITVRNDRYITSYFLDKKGKENASIKKNSLTTFIFEQCTFPITIKKLVELIAEHFAQASQERIMDTIRTLIEQQFLWYALYPQICTFDPLGELKKKVPQEYKKPLEELERKIQCYNSMPINEGEEYLFQITDMMTQKATSRRFALQVDLSVPEKQLDLPQELLKHAAKGGEILWKLNTLKDPLLPLKKTHLKFLKKYGQRRLIPLNELLDPVIGLGSPDYDKVKTNEKEQAKLSEYYQNLSEMLSKALKNREQEIALDEKSIASLVPDDTDYTQANSSIDIFFEIYANSLDEINSGQYQILITNFVNSGGATFGRFMDLLSPELTEKLKAFYDEEAKLDKDVLFVESFYLPQNPNVQNVAISPSFRTNKMDLSSKEESTISLDEVYVGATKEFLYLTDAVGAKDFRFVSTNVLVDIHAPEPLRFIREVTQQRNGRMQLWPWGPCASHTYLPRLTYQNLILSPQRWMIRLSCIQADKGESIQAMSEKLANWISLWQLPKFVFIAEGDNRLLINSLCKEHLHIAAAYLKRDEKIFLIEKIGQEKGAWFKSDQGEHSAEFVLPLMRNPVYANPNRKIPQVAYQEIPKSTRCKVPGSEWMYYKFQLYQDVQNLFLEQHLAPFADELLDRQLIQGWFFIRYQENEKDEIRLRMRVYSESCASEVFNQMREFTMSLFEIALIQDLSISVYEREVERYGGLELIDLCEKLFCVDSYLTLELLKFKSEELPIHIIGVLSIIDLLEHLLSDPYTTREFFSRLDIDKEGLSGYRDWRKILETRFQKTFGSIGDSRASVLRAIAEKVSELGVSPSVNIYSLAASIVHMHCNRLLGIDPSIENKVTAYAAHFTKKAMQAREYAILKR